MKVSLILIAIIGCVALLAYAVMAIKSQSKPEILGLNQGKLSPCPDSPNCVCSEPQEKKSPQHDIKPMTGNEATWLKLKAIILQQGGVIQQDRGNYLHATFTSSFFRYVDDVEFRYDNKNNVIHIRSASRIGHSDLGVNRKRVRAIFQDL